MSLTLTAFRKMFEDPKYVGLLALTVAILIFYPTITYVFSPYFIWLITFNYYDMAFYLSFINYNIISPREFAVKALLFIIVLSAAVLTSIGISQKLTKIIAKEPEGETKSIEVIQYWKTSKKITSTVLILEYLALITLTALFFLLWYDIFQQYISIFLRLARYNLIIISALGILYLIQPILDDKGNLTQVCLNIIDSIKEGYSKEYIKKIELAYSVLYVLLNHILSKNVKELEESNLEPPLTTLYIALLKGEKETLNIAKTLTTSLLKAIIDENVSDILKHLSEIDKKLGDVKELAKTMEISISYPNLALYTFTPSKKITRLKAILPLITQILFAVFIFLEKWIYYTKI